MNKPFLIDTQEIKVAVDLVVVGYEKENLHTLLIQREFAPDEGMWALPGGFILNDESLEKAVDRVLKDETGLSVLDFRAEIGTFGMVSRDPRRRVISIGFLLLTDHLGLVSGQTKDYQSTRDAKWLNWSDIPEDLAFDHEDIFERAKEYIVENLYSKPLAKELMPSKFSFAELQILYEKLLNTELEKRNFRKIITSKGLLEDLEEKRTGNHRPASLYKFK